jgi:hypothetical protein
MKQLSVLAISLTLQLLSRCALPCGPESGASFGSPIYMCLDVCFDSVMENVLVAMAHPRDEKVKGLQFSVDAFESSLGPGGTIGAVHLAIACIPESPESLPK